MKTAAVLAVISLAACASPVAQDGGTATVCVSPDSSSTVCSPPCGFGQICRRVVSDMGTAPMCVSACSERPVTPCGARCTGQEQCVVISAADLRCCQTPAPDAQGCRQL